MSTILKWIGGIVLLFIVFSLFRSKPDDDSKDNTNKDAVEQRERRRDNNNLPDEMKLNEALRKGAITYSFNSRSTYREAILTVNNQSDEDFDLEIDAGLFFKNPDVNRQSLIILSDIDKRIGPNEQVDILLSTGCTDAGKSVPRPITNWDNVEAPKNLDVALGYYGEYEGSIAKWLKKKNPEKLGSSAQQKRFKQVVIWSYMGNDYNQILNMLADNVFHDDIASAKSWLNEIYDEAREISDLIRDRDRNGIKRWLAQKMANAAEGAGEALDRGRRALDNFRNRD